MTRGACLFDPPWLEVKAAARSVQRYQRSEIAGGAVVVIGEQPTFSFSPERRLAFVLRSLDEYGHVLQSELGESQAFGIASELEHLAGIVQRVIELLELERPVALGLARRCLLSVLEQRPPLCAGCDCSLARCVRRSRPCCPDCRCVRASLKGGCT